MTSYASPVDAETFGDYTIRRDPGDTRPLYRFTGRITEDGSSGYPAEPGRYHLYAGWFCPWSQRVTIQRALNGLQDVLSVSYVDGARDGRGWAFRAEHGPDPVNGFTLLREAYDRTEPGFDGHVSVPTLWDRATGRVVSNDYATIGIDLATQFGRWGYGEQTYPAQLRDQVEALDAVIGPDLNKGVLVAGGTGTAAAEARGRLVRLLGELDERLSNSRYLLGSTLTEADVRLWVTLVRYDASHNVDGRIGPSLPHYPSLWAYARDLYGQPAFLATTKFSSFTAPGADVLDWSEPQARETLATDVALQI